MESSVWSGNFPTLAAFTKHATASSSNTNNENSSSSGNKGNNGADVSYYKKLPSPTSVRSQSLPLQRASLAHPSLYLHLA